MNQEITSFEKKRYFYYVLALIICFMAGLGYTWSVVQTPFVTQLHAEDKVATVTLVYTVNVLCATMTPTIFGALIRKLGTKGTLVLGGILFGVGYLGCAFITNIAGLFIFYALGTGIGTGMCYPTMMAYAASIIPEKQGLSTGLMAGIYGGSAMVWNPVLAYLLSNDYETTFYIIGAICLVVLVLCGVLIKPVPEGYLDYKKSTMAPVQARDDDSGKPRLVRHVEDKNRGQMIRSSMFYVEFITFVFGCTSGMMVVSQVSPIMQNSFNVTAAQASMYASLMSLASLIGRILWGAVTDKTDKYVTLSIICALPVITMGVLAVSHNMGVTVVCMFVTLLCYGGFAGTITPITADLFGTKYLTENYGVMYLIFGFAGLIGPRLAVSLRNGGDYSKAYLIACILAAISLIAALTIRRKVKSSYVMEEAVE